MSTALAFLTIALTFAVPDSARVSPGDPGRRPDAATDLRVSIAPAETLAVSIAGDGHPIVLLSGSLGSAFSWRHVSAALVERGYQVITIDPLGMGRSARPRHADFSLEAQGERVRAVLDSLQVAAPLIAAHGVSGSIAMRLALAHPERVAALLSIEGGPAERAGSPGIRKALALAPLLRLFGGRGMLRGRIRSGLREGSGDPAWVTEEVVDRYADGPGNDVGATLRTLGAMADAREPLALAPRLRRLALPMTVLVGGAPHAGGPGARELALLRDSLPEAAFLSVERAGHYLQEERPEVVVQAITELAERAASRAEAPGRETLP